MTTPTKRLQIKIPYELSAAIRRVALSERRTEHGCVLNILLTTPSLQVALKEETVRLSEQVDVVSYEGQVVRRSVLDVVKSPAVALASPEVPVWSLIEAAPEDICSKPEDLVSLSPARYCHSWEVRARSLGAELGQEVRPGYDNSPGVTRYSPCPPEGLDWFTVYIDGRPKISGTESAVRG